MLSTQVTEVKESMWQKWQQAGVVSDVHSDRKLYRTNTARTNSVSKKYC